MSYTNDELVDRLGSSAVNDAAFDAAAKQYCALMNEEGEPTRECAELAVRVQATLNNRFKDPQSFSDLFRFRGPSMILDLFWFGIQGLIEDPQDHIPLPGNVLVFVGRHLRECPECLGTACERVAHLFLGPEDILAIFPTEAPN